MLLKADAKRLEAIPNHATGILVRAQLPNGKWGSVDIIHLDREGLIEWLGSRDPSFVVNVVLCLLGHKQIQ